MAFAGAVGDRTSSARKRYSSNMLDERSFSLYTAPSSAASSRPVSQQTLSNEARASLQRRFTMNNLPSIGTISPIGQERMQNPDGVMPDMPQSMNRSQAQLYEKKQAEIEFLRLKRQEFQYQMDNLQRDIEQLQTPSANPQVGQSEPATPPDILENSFSAPLGRVNRFSTSSLITPAGLPNFSSKTSSQANPPPADERERAYQALTAGQPSQSIPGSRRDSDEEDDHLYSRDVPKFNRRFGKSFNRNSMPVTRRDLSARNGISDMPGIGQLDTTSFLLEDDDEQPSPPKASVPPSQASSTILQMHTTEDRFPILVRRETNGMTQSSNESPEHDLESHRGDWPAFFNGSGPTGDSPPNSLLHNGSSGFGTPTKTGAANRHSMSAKIGSFSESKRTSAIHTPAEPVPAQAPPPKLHPSFSTPAVPTVNSIGSAITAASAASQNPVVGRIPSGKLNTSRQSRDLSAESKIIEVQETSPNLHSGFSNIVSPLSSNVSLASPMSNGLSNPVSSMNGSTFTGQNFYGGYGGMQPNMQLMNTAMSNFNLSGTQSAPWSSPMAVYSQGYGGYNAYQQIGGGRLQDSQIQAVHQRRNQSEDVSRFSNITLEQIQGEIFSLCKDQYGCRYLQKKLEDRKPEHIAIIFEETKDHMYELMTDPFGNYLCQKLLENANDSQRTTLINNAAPHLVDIALNQHGTRALQKMIESISTPEQVTTVTLALRDKVVPMIQDLNGNHVVQKCLTRLSNEEAQFVFDAVAANCVAVGTHRHGCCVMQRCVDHASGSQRAQLVDSIIQNSIPLVQDPFGNYVLQYIFDLNEPNFSQPLSRTFIGHIVILATQKFSSNVIEKCLRIADSDTKHAMIQEMINLPDFGRFVDDNFANYVVQTACEYADPEDEVALIDRIRPCLVRLRNRPHGRRLQSRINERDKRMGITTSGSVTPNNISSPDSAPLTLQHRSNSGQDPIGLQSPQNGLAVYSGQAYGAAHPFGYGNQFGNAQAPRFGNPGPLGNMNQYQNQNYGHQQFGPIGHRVPQHGTNFY